jgi:hypothetical protein
MPHVENAASGFADYREGFDQQFVEDFLDRLKAIVIDLLLTIRVGVRFVSDVAQPILDAGAKFFRFDTQLLVGEALDLRFERIDGLDTRQHALHFALVPGAKYFA